MELYDALLPDCVVDWLRSCGQWRLQYSAPQAAGGHETRPYDLLRATGRGRPREPPLRLAADSLRSLAAARVSLASTVAPGPG